MGDVLFFSFRDNHPRYRLALEDFVKDNNVVFTHTKVRWVDKRGWPLMKVFNDRKLVMVICFKYLRCVTHIRKTLNSVEMKRREN